MSNFKVVLSATKYKPSNTQSIEKDSEGYYKVRLGAYNVFNSVNDFYLAKGVNELVNNKNSFFWRRLKKGYLWGEMGHPKMKPGMSVQEFINRNANIDQDRVACHIKDIEIEATNESVAGMEKYGKVLIVHGWVKPMGPMGPYLQEALDNPNVNIAFSVRSLSSDTVIDGINVKETKAILGWDWVNEPGINNANTFDMLTGKVVNTEHLDTTIQLEVNDADLDNLKDTKNKILDQESAETMTEIIDIIGSNLSKKTSVNRILGW